MNHLGENRLSYTEPVSAHNQIVALAETQAKRTHEKNGFSNEIS